MDQQQFNPYAPQPEATSGPIPYPGQDGQLQGQFANAGQQVYQPDYGMQQSAGVQPMQASQQQPYGAVQPHPAQAAWQQGSFPVQGQQPYGYQEPQQPAMSVQDSQQFSAPVQGQPQAQMPTQEQQPLYSSAQGQQPYQPSVAEQQPYPMTAQASQPYQGQPMQQPQPMYGGPAAMPPVQDVSGAQSRSGLAIAGMIIGIVSLVCSPIPIVNNFIFFVAIVGLILSIIGFRGVAKKPAQKGKGMAIAGIILSAVAMVLVLASQAFYGAVLDEVSDQLNESAASYSSGSATAYTQSASFSADAGDDSDLPATGSSSDSAEKGAASAVGATQDLALGAEAAFSDGTTVTVVAVMPGLANFDGSPVTCVTVQYTNEGSANIIFNPYDWKAQDPQGAQRSQTYYVDEESPLHAGEVTPGGTVTGNLYFDEPIAKIVYSPSLFSSDGDVSWVVA